jgi:hypothetical protein
VKRGMLHRIAHWVRSAHAFAAVITLLTPLWLGPTLAHVVRVADEMSHTCACGMAPGKCGCPTCIRLEQERHHRSGVLPVVRATCDEDSTPLPSAPVSVCALQPSVALPIGLDGSLISVHALGPPYLRIPDGPPRPPPRIVDVPQPIG